MRQQAAERWQDINSKISRGLWSSSSVLRPRIRRSILSTNISFHLRLRGKIRLDKAAIEHWSFHAPGKHIGYLGRRW
jgi:hypothetical protein